MDRKQDVLYRSMSIRLLTGDGGWMADGWRMEQVIVRPVRRLRKERVR